MESKAADAASPLGAEELARMKAVAESKEPVTGLRRTPPEQAATFMGSVAPAVERYWAVLKSQARAAGEYTTLRTRQGVSLFGEPNIGAIKTIVDSC